MRNGLATIEVVAIGEELLTGATIDTNSVTIAKKLEPAGLRVARVTAVSDSSDAIADAVAAALERTRAVITTGGLGPTRDDMSKAAVAGVFGRELEFREDLWEALQRRWARRGKIPETNRVQAEVPRGASVFPNPRGTAPGLLLEDEALGLCIMLPGPPDEMEHILIESVVPYLAERAGSTALRPYRRYLRTTGIAESAIAEKLGGRLDDLPVQVAHLPEIDGNDIRLTAWATDEAEVGDALDEATRRLRELLGLHVYAEREADLAEVVGDLLRERGLSVVVAESCTAGLIATRLTECAGSSDYFWGGMVVYDDRAKIELLGVSEETLKKHGAVSEAAAREMAEGAMRRSGAGCAIAVTGIAGPGGATDEKPVGTVWLAAHYGDVTEAKVRHYPGTRDVVRIRAAQAGLDMLRRMILHHIS
jgi:nicotinamide-nucleotide amidase